VVVSLMPIVLPCVVKLRNTNVILLAQKVMRKQGIVTVSFSIGADGSISGASIAKSSGAEDLDNAALSAVNSARSIGPRPAGMGPSITVPISFKIN